MTASLVKIKCEKIRRIQARGLRVLILQSGKVEVWPKGEPGNVSRYSCLDHADFDTELGGPGTAGGRG